MLAVVAIVVVFPPATICPITPPKYCNVVGELSDSRTVAQRHMVRRSSPSTGIGQILCLQVCELALLRRHLQVKQVVVDLRHQRFSVCVCVCTYGHARRKALVSQINYNVFDIEVGSQQSQFAYLQAKDLADSVEGLLRTHDVALWNGNDTSLSNPTTPQYYGAAGQIDAGGNVATIATTASIVDGFKSTIAQMVANSNYEVRPTAIYSNPVLLDLIDREMKAEFNVVLYDSEIAGGLVVKTLSTQAGELPLIPDWTIPYTGTPGSGSAIAGLHRQRRHDRVSLVDRSESAGLPAGYCPVRWLRRWWW